MQQIAERNPAAERILECGSDAVNHLVAPFEVRHPVSLHAQRVWRTCAAEKLMRPIPDVFDDRSVAQRPVRAVIVVADVAHPCVTVT